MSITYTGAGGLFTRLGKIIKAVNVFLALQAATILDAADKILDEYNDRRDLVQDLLSQYQGAAGSVQGWIGQSLYSVDRTLADLQSELNAPSADTAAILPLLVRRMRADSASVDASAVSAPVVTAAAGNTGSGVLLADIVNGEGFTDERIITETVLATCIADQFTGADAGAEMFTLTGWPRRDASDGVNARGSGPGPSIRPATADSLMSNGGFETWTADAPDDGWTLSAGTAGTHVIEETTTTQPATGGSALKLHGDGAAGTVTLSYALAELLEPQTRYCAGAWARKVAAMTAGSNLLIAVRGTGMADVVLFNADPNTLTTSYALKSVWFSTPAAIPANLRLEITWTTAATAGNGAEILIDEAAVVSPAVLGYVNYALWRGPADFLIGDSMSVATANDGAGVIQTFFGRFYGTLLPSNGAGAETIADSLAT